jgi:hypothetical protein
MLLLQRPGRPEHSTETHKWCYNTFNGVVTQLMVL